VKRKLLCQIAVLLAVVLVFAAFNGSMYALLTGRLHNNFSDTSQAKMWTLENICLLKPKATWYGWMGWKR